MSPASNRVTHLLLLLVFFALVINIGLLAKSAVGGTLDPPGPVGSTMKTLQEVEPRTPISSLPYTITLPGSYYLTNNLTMGADATGITVSAANVTIDLNGFTLTNTSGGGCTPAASADGILDLGGLLVVHNGTVRGWQRGIVGGFRLHALSVICNGIGVSVTTGGRASDMEVSGNSNVGIYLTGEGARVEHNSLHVNVNAILVSAFGVGNTIQSNTLTGNATAIRVDGPLNVVVQNMLANNVTDMNLVSTTNYAPVQSPPAVTDPWANIVY